MPLVPDDVKLRIKREVSIQRLAEARGIKLRRVGKELIGLCPFHDDHSPSLNIDPVQNVWHCKGACGEGGDVFKWVMRAEGVSFKHALELLKRDYQPTAGPPPKISTVPKLPPLCEATADDKKLLRAVVDHYHEALKRTPEAQQYLIRRGLQSAEMLERFRLGFSNRSLCYRLQGHNRIAGAEQRRRLKQLGVLRNQTPGHEHFRGSLVIPILNLDGDVVQMYGRKINSNLRAGTEYHLYLPGPRCGVWNEEALIASKDVILCEALIDALTFWCADYRHVTSSYGVNGFNDYHRDAFRKHGTKRVYIAYDRDEAGDKAATKHAEELMQMGIECFRVQFPKGQDANQYACMTTPAAKALGVLLNGAAWMGTSKRPSVAVIEPTPATAPAAPAIEIEEELEPEPMKNPPPSTPPAPAEEKPKPAAKEKIAIETPTVSSSGESVFPLAATNPIPAEEPTPRPMPLANPPEPVIEINGDEINVTFGPRTYRVLGLEKNTTRGAIKVNVRVSGNNLRGEYLSHSDTLDMEVARQRMAFAKLAAHELAVKEPPVYREVGRLLDILGQMQQQQISQAQQTAAEETTMTAGEQAAALELLRDPRLLERVLEDFEHCGVVGEETNKIVAYLGAVSRLLHKPLAIVVQSSSSAGKSSLMEAVLDFVPEEQREEYSAMTGQALFYMGEKDLKHKILAVAEEEGASRAAYALKLLQSEGELKIASTGKDPVSGKHVTHEYKVEGPVMIFLTTTAQDVDEELLNRSIVLTVNEEQAQTRAIHRKQREAQTIEGLWAQEDRAELIRLHRNAQRLLRPIRVVNEHVNEQAFPDYMIRTRRDHMKFLTLVQAIALLHQHQREIKTSTRRGKTLEYIEATAEDVKLAYELVNAVLTPSLEDLQTQTRRLLLLIDQMVTEQCQQPEIERGDYRFTRATVRQYTHWSDSQLKRHLHRLEELEYLIVRQAGQTFVYQVNFELDESGKPVLPGLRYSYDANRSGVEGHRSAPSPGQVRGVSGGGTGEESPVMTRVGSDFSEKSQKHSYPDPAKNGQGVVIVPAPPRANGGAKPNGTARAAGAD